MKMSYSIDINSTPETVFSWLERPEKAMAWMNSVSKTEMLHETPDMVGSIFRAPYHTISHTGLVGGSNWPYPGDISLAHRDVLFLNEGQNRCDCGIRPSRSGQFSPSWSRYLLLA
jgi:hypothetical protein